MDAREKTSDEKDALGGRVRWGGERRATALKRDSRRCLAIGHHAVLETLAEYGARNEFGEDTLVVEHESARGEEAEGELAGGVF